MSLSRLGHEREALNLPCGRLGGGAENGRRVSEMRDGEKDG